MIKKIKNTVNRKNSVYQTFQTKGEPNLENVTQTTTQNLHAFYVSITPVLQNTCTINVQVINPDVNLGYTTLDLNCHIKE